MTDVLADSAYEDESVVAARKFPSLEVVATRPAQAGYHWMLLYPNQRDAVRSARR